MIRLWDNFGVKIRLEISDKLYSRLARQAKTQNCSLGSMIVRAIEASLHENRIGSQRRAKPPIVHSKKPGTLHLDNARIFEIIDFP